MGRGVSTGGGQSSLGYLFGSGEAPTPTPPKDHPTSEPKVTVIPPQVDNSKPTPPSTAGHATNNYPRADGQNCGNFITDRPSTKVHAAPGGGSSLDYLSGNGSK